MFTYTDTTVDDGLLSTSPVVDLIAAGHDSQRLERQSNARTILSAYRIGLARFHDILTRTDELNPHIGHHADKACTGEISLQFGVSKTMAGSWFALGAKRDNLPIILSAYLDGQFSYRRAHLLATTLTGVHTDNLDHAQSDAIALAREPLTDTTLRDRLDALIIELDPDKAAADREKFTNNQNIRVTKDRHGHSTLDGCIPAAQGEHHRQRITTLITQRLCEHDSRSTRQRRVAALADIQGMTTLARDCTTSQCPAAAAVTTAPTPSAPVATTLTLRTGHLAHLGRYGTTDPTLADHLVPDSGDNREITPSALTYRPSRALIADILATDRTCRYPFCDTPAEDCDIDHITPFDHNDPRRGKLTINRNLAPICTPDHHRKHHGD
ncbi:HNH endonuclease signature motif containing protein [Williamsia sterculiae]|uniref:DUF222 domain-containing protein n=1 Tax=Williamsia sterculiae TaxID=1344003 RepID=A0A1N7H6G0_9NOCA|nr:HNH endonuclease signature motif containing protein [Williamsia sterculiae]SIS20363.1 hypothetical protein SAMN05445060_3594 [Williamsia sterculiae]